MATLLQIEPALQRAASITQWIPPDGSMAAGRCLEFVDWCYGNPTSRMGDLGPLPGGAANGNWQDAKQGWYGSANQHPGDGTDAPRGAPVYWETGPSGNQAGHIVISAGDGWCYTTDYAGPRSVSLQRISYLNSLRGRALGWTGDYGNNPIDRNLGGFLMALTDAQQEEVYNAVKQLQAQEIVPGAGYSWSHAVLNDLRSALITPNANSGQFRPIDVILTHSTGIMKAVNENLAQGAALNAALESTLKALKAGGTGTVIDVAQIQKAAAAGAKEALASTAFTVTPVEAPKPTA